MLLGSVYTGHGVSIIYPAHPAVWIAGWADLEIQVEAGCLSAIKHKTAPHVCLGFRDTFRARLIAKHIIVSQPL
jgi:hypothetical protein